MMNLLIEEKRVSEEERLEVKVRRGRKREEEERFWCLEEVVSVLEGKEQTLL
jgi:NAD kinase